MTTPTDLYPFSTRDGKVIPLDIIRSKTLIPIAVNTLATSLITLPTGSTVALIYSTVDCIIKLNSTSGTLLPIDNVPIAKGIFIPARAAIAAAVEAGSAVAQSISKNGVLYVQVVEQWAGLGLDANYSKL